MPGRCVHIGDRESDIYELFCKAHQLKTHFLVRTCVDRLAGEGKHTIVDEMDEVKIKGFHSVEMIDKKGTHTKIKLALKYRRIQEISSIAINGTPCG